MSSNIEQLVLWKRLIPAQNKTWMSQPYPKLKYFAYHLDEELKVTDELKAFFQRNKNIEKFSLLSNNIQTVRQCVENGIEINELFFKSTCDIKVNLTILKDFCGDDLSKRLHLLFYSTTMLKEDNLELFMSLKPNVDGLYFNDQQFFEDELVDAIKTFHQLKVVQLPPTHHSFVVSLIADLPVLEEVYIYDNLYASEIGIDVNWFSKQAEIVSSLIERSRKLKKIFLWRTHDTLQFEEYDKQRKELVGAEQLTVFLSVNSQWKFLFKDKWKLDTFDVIVTEKKHIRNPLVKIFLNNSF